MLLSNYRVRQVLALGKMPENQLRLLLALATHLDDDSRSVRLGFQTLIRESGNVRNTVKAARRELEEQGKLKSTGGGRGPGDKPLWTVLCLPEKGVSDVDPLAEADSSPKGISDVDPLAEADSSPKGVSDVDPHSQDAKGVNGTPLRGSTDPEKGGQPESADLRKPDALLYRPAKPSCSLSLAAPQAADGSNGPRDERDDDVIEGKITSTPAGATPLARRISAAVGCTLEDAEAFIAHMRRNPKVRSATALLNTALGNGTIADLFAEESASAAAVAELLNRARQAPSQPAPQPTPDTPRPAPDVPEPQVPGWKQVECPACKAAPGAFCRNPATGGHAATHKERHRAADDHQTEEIAP